jgi:hypothetical protein
MLFWAFLFVFNFFNSFHQSVSSGLAGLPDFPQRRHLSSSFPGSHRSKGPKDSVTAAVLDRKVPINAC